jgi:DNA-binding NarL/FixJ family response regulator
MSSVTRVVVGVADYLVGEGLVRALEAGRKLSVVSICSNLGALLAATEDDAPDAVVTELRLAPTHSDEGLRLAAQLRHTHPGLGVVVLGEESDSALALSLFEGGAPRAYLLTRQIQDSRELIRALDEVGSGRSLVHTAAVAGLRNLPGVRPVDQAARLTAREREIMTLVAKAESNRAIAQALGITTRAVERHINSIFRKLSLAETQGVNRRVKAALVFNGLAGEPGT